MRRRSGDDQLRQFMRRSARLRADLRRAYGEFLGVPTAVVAGFLVLAMLMNTLDQASIAALDPVRTFMRAHVLGDVAVTRGLLAAIAGGIITVTSITFSILLLAVQQSATALTSQVFDQFLRRPLNQAFFGYYVGTALYTLLIFASVSSPFNPVLGASLALALTVGALYLLLVLFYVTVNQMRPSVSIQAIHDHVLAARRRQRRLLRRMRTTAALHGASARQTVVAQDNGFVAHLALDDLEKAIGDAQGEVEIVLQCQVGSYVAFHDPLADISARTPDDLAPVAEVLERAIELAPRRDIRVDPAFGLVQLETIAWTSISPAKANPAPGILTVRVLRDLLSRWSDQAANDAEEGTTQAQPAPCVLPIVYHDTVPEQWERTIEALAVAASTASQYRIIAEILWMYAVTFGRLPEDQRERAEILILRVLPILRELDPTAELVEAMRALETSLQNSSRYATASVAMQAREALVQRVGCIDQHPERPQDGR